MTEFAIAIPVLFILFAGGWEMARGLWMYEALNKGVRDAARYLARVDDPNSANSLEMARRLVLTGDIDLDQPPRFDYNLVTVAVGTKSYDPTIPFDGSGHTYRGPGGSTADIQVVRVQAELQFSAPLLFFLNFTDPLTITVMHEERHIGD